MDHSLIDELCSLKITLEADKPLLSAWLRRKLNPMLVTIQAVKDVPSKEAPAKFKPVYCTVQNVDNETYQTQSLPQQSNCRFRHKHCLLVGKNDAAQLKEWLASKPFRVYLHDNDEWAGAAEGAEYSKGMAQFSLRDLLRPFCRSVKLRSEVFPTKRVHEDTTQELDLNSTAKKGVRVQDKLNPYLMHATYCVILVNLTYTIKAFDPADVEGDDGPQETAEQFVSGPEGGSIEFGKSLKSVNSLRESQMSQDEGGRKKTKKGKKESEPLASPTKTPVPVEPQTP